MQVLWPKPIDRGSAWRWRTVIPSSPVPPAPGLTKWNYSRMPDGELVPDVLDPKVWVAEQLPLSMWTARSTARYRRKAFLVAVGGGAFFGFLAALVAVGRGNA